MSNHPSYGHKRIALALGINKKRVLRVMKKFGIKPYKRRVQQPKKEGNQNHNFSHNWIQKYTPLAPNTIWASDFTYIKFQGKFYYMATVIDIFSKEIKGLSIGENHDTSLVKTALENAIKNHNPPQFIHSDRGSEYCSEEYLQYVSSLGIISSFSGKGKPWENGYQESFYSQFKLELGEVSRFPFKGELIEAIYLQIYYYNNHRIHSAIKMPPALFARNFYSSSKTVQ